VLVGELDEVDYDLEVDGEQVRRTVHRRVFERGAWATVAIVFEQRGEAGWSAPKLALIRMQKVREAWKKHAAITLSGADAKVLGDALAGWFAAPGPDDDVAD
jgi:hypothetical protein